MGPGEVLAPIKSFRRVVGISVMRGRQSVTYHTLLLPQHGILFAEDLPVESFYPGKYGMGVLSLSERYQILARVPRLMADPVHGYGDRARPFMSKSELEGLVRSGRARLAAHALDDSLTAYFAAPTRCFPRRGDGARAALVAAVSYRAGCPAPCFGIVERVGLGVDCASCLV